jgi:hypothetical protein
VTAPGLLSPTAGTSGPAGDLLTASASGPSTEGAAVTVNPDGSFAYTPPPGFTGTDTFSYTVTDTPTATTRPGRSRS